MMTDTQKENDETAPRTNCGAEDSSSEVVLLPADSLKFRRESGRLFMLKQGEEDWREVSLVRLFPLTEPEKWISVQDSEEKEIGIIPDLKGMTQESLSIVREHLDKRYLVPEILRIVACRARFDLTEWEVETNRGKVTILTRNLRDNVQRPLPNRLALIDVEGNRYDIPDIEALDPMSRRLLEERI